MAGKVRPRSSAELGDPGDVESVTSAPAWDGVKHVCQYLRNGAML